MDKLCYEVWADDVHCFTFAKTPAAARWNAVNAGREAGYFIDHWPSPLVAKRAPQYDNSRLKDCGARRCYSPDFMF